MTCIGLNDVIAVSVGLNSHGWKAKGRKASLHDLCAHVCVISASVSKMFHHCQQKQSEL